MTPGRVSGWRLSLVLAVLATGSVRAQWEPTSPGDPNRRWVASVRLGTGYDDNVYTASRNRQGALTGSVTPSLGINFPTERTALGLHYTYNATYYDFSNNQTSSKINQSHAGDTSLNYSFNPRLSLSLWDYFRRGLEPSLVQDVNGNPVLVRQRGDYTYNRVGGSLNYQLSRRWVMSLSGGWEWWSYDQAVYARADNRDTYSTTMSAQYSLTPRAQTGLSYQFGDLHYQNSQLAKYSDTTSHTVYVPLVYRFNPQWSGQLAGGLTFNTFADGQSSTSPYFTCSTAYNPGRFTTVSGGVSYLSAVTETYGYRNTESVQLYVRGEHRLTTRLRLAMNAVYNLTDYRNPPPTLSGLPSTQSQTSWALGLSLSYSLERWLSVVANYTHDEIAGQVSSQSYDRNRVSVGVQFTY